MWLCLKIHPFGVNILHFDVNSLYPFVMKEIISKSLIFSLLFEEEVSSPNSLKPIGW